MGRKRRNALLDGAVYLLALGVFRLAELLPRRLFLSFGRFLGWLLWTLLRIERRRLRVVVENMAYLYPAASVSGRAALARRVCRHFGHFIAECGRAPSYQRADCIDRFRFAGLERLERACRGGKGVIVATAHFGCFEMGAAALAQMGYPVSSVIRTVDNPLLDDLIDGQRSRAGVNVIKKEQAAREILRRLRAGELVTTHTDLHAAFNHIFIPFLGKWAATFTTPAVMSLRTGAPVIPFYCFYDAVTDKMRARIYPAVTITPTGDHDADVRQIMLAINATLEEVVREAPEQWFWLHRRWKIEPSPEDIAAIRRQDDLIRAAREKASAS
ncbi:MAG: lysophospholipid acyltransferase family protein [Nitrospinae bacterium]|nr:lysophospholipid acyltransferase family protein [Nitrospinota bacterium]